MIINVEVEINCGDRLFYVIRMHDLDFVMKATHIESILLSSQSYKLKNAGLR